MTGHGLVLSVEAEFFARPQAAQVRELDGRLAAFFPSLACARPIWSPVPLLGVPGWTKSNAKARYYDNVRYFRPGRRAAARA